MRRSVSISVHQWFERIGKLLTCALAVLAVVSLPAHPDRRANAERHRAMMWERMPYERWFIPGELGHERGKPLPPVGGEAFLFRNLGPVDESPAGRWARRNQLTDRPAIRHSLDRILPVELFDDHPEYFPLVDGERWRPPDLRRPNWNPDLGEPGVAAHVAAWVNGYFRENPWTRAVSIGTNDALTYGDSEATRRWTYPPRWFRHRPDYSDLVFAFSNAVAEAIAKDWPDRYVGQLAYYWTENVPSFPVHPQVIPFLASDPSQIYCPEFRETEWALLEAWGRSGAERLGQWQYLFGSGFLIPRQHVGLLAEYLRRARAAGYTDYFAQSGFNWGLDGPQPWVVTRLLADPFQSLEPLLEEYYTRYFRAAAAPMRKFFDTCERIWREQPGPAYWLKHFRNESQAELFPTAVNRELRALLNDAAARVRDDPVAAARVELTSAAFSVTEAFARFHEARQALADALMQRMEASDPDHLQALLEAYEAAREGGELRGQITDYGLRGQITDYGLEIMNAEGPDSSVIHNPESVIPLPGFKPVWHHVQQYHPLAMSRANLDVYLMNDPGPTAAALLDQRVGAGAVRHPVSPDLSWDLEAELSGGIVLAGLTYRLDMPPGWSARVEPFEGARAEFESGITDYGLEIMNTEGAVSSVIHNPKFIIQNQKRLEAWHWSAIPPDAVGLASIGVRGRLSPSAFLLLRASWVDAQQRFVGEEAVVRLHEGDHPDWKPLRLFLDPPEGAAFLRYRLNAFHMMPGDWLELREPAVEWFFR